MAGLIKEKKLRFDVPPGKKKERIDLSLASQIENATRSKVQKLIEANLVKVDGNFVKPSYKVLPNDIIEAVIPISPRPEETEPEDIPLNIVYEDEYLIIVNKPAGMVAHPAYSNYTGTLVNALLHHTQKLSELNEPGRPGIVHRLDKDTSGLLVAAKDEWTHAQLAKQFSKHTIEREYWTVVWGNFKQRKGEIDTFITRSKKDRKKFAASIPPTLPGDLVLEIPPDPNVFDVKPPAVEGFGTHCAGLDRGINLALGEMNLLVSEQGGGWGWQATAGSPCLTTLVFQFTPPRAGNILVDAYVEFKGQFALSAHDHWYTSNRADITLSVSSRLYQHYWEFGPSETLINEHRTDSSNSGWIDRLVKLSYSTSVSANDTVLIFVEEVLDTNAHSSHAKVDVDFKTGAERRIKVPVIQMRYF